MLIILLILCCCSFFAMFCKLKLFWYLPFCQLHCYCASHPSWHFCSFAIFAPIVICDRKLTMVMRHGKIRDRRKNYSRQTLPLTDWMWRQMKTELMTSMTNTDRERSGDRSRDRFNRQNFWKKKKKEEDPEQSETQHLTPRQISLLCLTEKWRHRKKEKERERHQRQEMREAIWRQAIHTEILETCSQKANIEKS